MHTYPTAAHAGRTNPARRIALALSTAIPLALTCATSAWAENPLPKDNENIVRYGTVEGWTIFANNTRRNCYISRQFGDSAVQLGVTDDIDIGYVGVFTKVDIDIKDGERTNIVISMDGNVYTGTGVGIKGHVQGGYSGGYFLTSSPEFKRDLAEKQEMIVFPETKAAFSVDLTGTYKAMDMGRACLKEQRSR